MITLMSNEEGKSFKIPKQRLVEVLPYFASLFDSPFSDSSKETFNVEKLPGTTYKVEEMLFIAYLDDPSSFRPNLCSNNEAKQSSLKDLVHLNRLATYYGIDLQATCESEILYSWRARSRSLTLSIQELEAYIKTIRALSLTTTSLDECQYPTKKSIFFAVFMEYRSSVLRLAWDLSPLQREKFWLELIEFTTESQYGRIHYDGMLIPYFRILQSLPARPHLGTDFVLDTLVETLDEAHFIAMARHRESNGHQREDFALHPSQLIRKFTPRQALWSWREWSDTHHHQARISREQGEESENNYVVLLFKLQQSWTFLCLNDQVQEILGKEKLDVLNSELSMLS